MSPSAPNPLRPSTVAQGGSGSALSPSKWQALADLLVWLADNKYWLGRRFSEWTNRAPALEAAVAAAAMTQDELGHARSLYAALQSAPDAPEAYLKEEKREQRLGMPLLTQPFEHWADFVTAVVLVDRALTLVFESARASSHEPLRQRAAKILQEEWFHRQYGEGWLRKLAADAGTRDALQASINRFWSPTAAWLGSGPSASLRQRTEPVEVAGPSTSLRGAPLWGRTGFDDGLVAGGVLAGDAEALRARWQSEAQALLTSCGLITHEQ